MIGTFWNLCRACPSMPVDKICFNSCHGKPEMLVSTGSELHSEYRSTYRWHEYTGPRQEVVRKPPQPLTGNKEEEENKNVENVIPPPTSDSSGLLPGGGIEPALPRRKKNPSLAYRTHDLLTRSASRDKDSTSLDRARMTTLPLEGGGLKNAISRISTEYRLQFAWPRGKRTTEEESTGPPRKSLSMGAIKPATAQNQSSQNQQQQSQQTHNQPAPVHKKRITQADKIAGTAELEPLVSNQEDYAGEEKIVQESFSKGEKLQLSDNAEFKTEYKKKFRPFSQYDYIEGRFKPKKEPEPQIVQEIENDHGDSWFSEVIELRKKAGEYKHRGWGTELVPEHIAELYNKQITLWEQVSRRSSLSALSLASSTHRSITKEEKEKENNKKSSPTKALWPEQLTKSNQKNEKSDDVKKDIPPRSRIDHFIRHHLERTTGVGEEGILHSPTREKLEPVIIRRKEPGADTTRSPQKVQTYSGRSQSAGPNTGSVENRSPKRAPRVIHGAKPPVSEKRQRPTTLDTAPSRTIQKTGSNKAANLKNKSTGSRTKQNQKCSQSITKEKAADEVETSEAEVLEPVVKSPPEPTRVKSPEQVLMRSPEPVNWTVPLDTGKTFTVTQNVSEGEGLCRPHSESKMRSESVEAPPPPPQSAPPALTDDTEWKKEEEVKKSYDKPVPGTTLRCLDDPSFTFDTSSHEQKPSSDVLEKAHSRFDQFWGKTNQENLDNQGQA